MLFLVTCSSVPVVTMVICCPMMHILSDIDSISFSNCTKHLDALWIRFTLAEAKKYNWQLSVSTKRPLFEESSLETLYHTQTAGNYFSEELMFFSENTTAYLHSCHVISALYRFITNPKYYCNWFYLKPKVASLRSKQQI